MVVPGSCFLCYKTIIIIQTVATVERRRALIYTARTSGVAGVRILLFLIDMCVFFITPENEQEPGLVLRSIAKTDDGLQQLCRATNSLTPRPTKFRLYTSQWSIVQSYLTPGLIAVQCHLR